MTKRNLILGLLVFMVGVLMAACGGSKGASGDTEVKKVPDTWEDAKCDNCTRTFKGTFRISEDDLYMQAFGHEEEVDLSFGSGVFGQVFGEVVVAVTEPASDILVCGTKVFLTEAIAKIFNVDDVDVECSSDEVDIFTNSNYEDLRSSYDAHLYVRYDDGEADRIELAVHSDVDSGDDREVFYYESSNVFTNSEDTLYLTNSSSRVRLVTKGGRVIGEFRD